MSGWRVTYVGEGVRPLGEFGVFARGTTATITEAMAKTLENDKDWQVVKPDEAPKAPPPAPPAKEEPKAEAPKAEEKKPEPPKAEEKKADDKDAKADDKGGKDAKAADKGNDKKSSGKNNKKGK